VGLAFATTLASGYVAILAATTATTTTATTTATTAALASFTTFAGALCIGRCTRRGLSS